VRIRVYHNVVQINFTLSFYPLAPWPSWPKSAESKQMASSDGKKTNNSGGSEAPGPLGSLPVVSGHLGPAANQLVSHHVVDDDQLTKSADFSTGRRQNDLCNCWLNKYCNILDVFHTHKLYI
jgi:hypothetical protein